MKFHKLKFLCGISLAFCFIILPAKAQTSNETSGLNSISPGTTTTTSTTTPPSSSSSTEVPSSTTKSPVVTSTPPTTPLPIEPEESIATNLSALLPENYVPYQLPVVDNAQFIPVFVSILISSVTDIDEKEGEITLDTQFSRRWIDYKISKRVTGRLQNVTLGPKALDEIWQPDLYFDGTPPTEKDATEANEKSLRVLFNSYPLKEAQIAFSERLRKTLDCEMEFHYYPADIQTCTYNLRSFIYKENQLKLFWETPNSVFLSDLGHPNFDIMVDSVWPSIPVNKTDKYFVFENFNPYRKGNYSALTFTIKARRKLSYHLVQTYLPSVLLIFMTWLCFLLPANMVEARIAISMTTVLTLTAMFSAVRGQAPSVSYTMFIDIWMVFCIFLVFMSLLLFIFVYWIKSKSDKDSELKSEDEMNLQEESVIVKLTNRYAFIIFAVIFILFVSIYWAVLITLSGYISDWVFQKDYNAQEKNHDTDHFHNHFYKYFSNDSAPLFKPELYPPSAKDILKNVFALVPNTTEKSNSSLSSGFRMVNTTWYIPVVFSVIRLYLPGCFGGNNY